MNNQVLIIYSSREGHTKKICGKIAAAMDTSGNEVELVPIAYAKPAMLENASKVMIGASIHYGKHSPEVYEFIRANHELLSQRKNALFSVNLVARKPEKNTPETNPYFKKFLRQIPWQPTLTAVFAGKVHYARYTPFDRFMIRFIMWITKGPTDPLTNVEFTDWQQVSDFAGEFDKL